MIEQLERRAFGALEFVDDLSEARVLAPLQVSATGVRLQRNRSGYYVVHGVDGHDDYTRAFDNPPTRPPRSSFTVTVSDPAQRYLPQTLSLPLPRWLPGGGGPSLADADNALKPVSVRLTPAACMPLQAAWAVLRLRVALSSNPELGLANVVVEARPALASLPLRRSFTDRHGEALVVIVSAPPFLPVAGPPAGLTRDFKVALTLVLDKAVVRPSSATEFPSPDPALILQRRTAGHADVRVVATGDQLFSAGARRRRTDLVTWP
jgi:hypothetical protein